MERAKGNIRNVLELSPSFIVQFVGNRIYLCITIAQRYLTLSLLKSYICGAPSKARNLTYIYMDDIFTGDFVS
jgi:hypothetical protein